MRVLKNNINIGIIEDDVKLAEHYQDQINKIDGYSCTHIFLTAEDAMSAIPQLNLDVVLTDIRLPVLSGIDCISYLKPLCPNVEFLIVTVFEEPETVFKALKAGATGYMTKCDSFSNILSAISEVHKGGSLMSSHIARKVISHFQTTNFNSDIDKLSIREQEIIELLSEGFRYKEIGDTLNISTETVRTHIRNMYQKLQVSSRTEALNKLYRKQQ